MPCSYCLDPLCNNGSICHGLFAASGEKFSPRATGPHSSTKKSSKQGQYESEHVFPHAALKLSGMNYNYQSEPTMSIPYQVHRGGQSGSGGGVSSTGSSNTASGWSGHLGGMAQNDFPGALRLAAIDEMNAHWVNNSLSRESTEQVMAVVNGHARLGRLTAQQASEINNAVIDYYYRRTNQ